MSYVLSLPAPNVRRGDAWLTTPMNGLLQRYAPQAGLIWLCCGGLATHCIAAPPINKSSSAIHLDLRAPEAREMFGGRTNALGGLAGLAGQHRSIGRADDSPGFALGGLETARSNGGALEMARRFHHEGLPVARLWENHSAFLSLGLSPKGKPGLWLIQKTH
jgi:hypothetical protein